MNQVQDSITCPSCGASIPVTETLHRQLSEHARVELRRELAKEQQALSRKAEEIQAKELEIERLQENIEAQVKERLALELQRVEEEASAKARTDVSLELRDLQENVREKDRKLQEAQANELQLRKEKRDLEGEKQELELRVARTIDAERQQIRDAAMSDALEEHRLRDAEKDHKLQEARRVNEELRRKLEQGSQQTQGEVLEIELEELLRAHCALDEIVPVAKGVRGADVLQRVRTKTGLSCGCILWETKFTKNWSDGWIEKLRNDQREAKADVAVLVTDVLPKDVDGFGFKDGVWLTNPRYVLAVLTALRHSLIEVGFAKAATASKNETVDALFIYLTGPEFRHRVEAIIRGFSQMQQDLEEEKRVSARRWAKREKQLDLIIGNTSGMYGDLQGLIGAPMQPIPALEAGDEHPESVDQPIPEAPSESITEDDIPF